MQWHEFESGAGLFMDRDKKEALENYKSIRMPEAEKKGLRAELLGARTLTEARKVMRGELRKKNAG